MKPHELRSAIGRWPWFTATAGGLGHMRPASGTWGSLPPVMLFVGMGWCDAPIGAHIVVQLALSVAASVGCLRHGGKVEAVVGRKDPGVVVVDEVAGMAATLVLAVVGVAVVGSPASGGANMLGAALPRTLMLAVAVGSFFWFRVMDVIKPPPARGLQRVPGGAGVLIDDLVVAPYSAIAVLVSLEIWVRYLQPAS